MLWLHPENVTIGGRIVRGVRAITLDRRSEQTVTERDATGGHIVFADVPRTRCDFTIVTEPHDGEAPPALPGEAVALSFRAAPGRSDAGSATISAEVVVTGVVTSLSRRRSEQRMTCVALSPDGVADPVVVQR